MLKIIDTGNPFNCTYCKTNGEFTEFMQIKKPVADVNQVQVVTEVTDKRRRRKATSYESLIPFLMQNFERRELYTRAIVIFNGEDVIL